MEVVGWGEFYRMNDKYYSVAEINGYMCDYQTYCYFDARSKCFLIDTFKQQNSLPYK